MPSASSFADCMNNLALVYKLAGQIDEALPLYEASLKGLKDRMGPDHDVTLTATNNLAQAFRDTGRLADALPSRKPWRSARPYSARPTQRR